MATDTEPLWDIVEEHLDEAEFLWGQWEHSLIAPNYTLAEVADGPEDRLMAHLDGLVVNGPLVAERLLIPTLADVDAEPTRVRAAALALLQSRGDDGVQAVFDAMLEFPPQRMELARALECCERRDLNSRLTPLLAAPDPELRHVAARVLAFHGDGFAGAVPGLLASSRSVDRGLGLSLVPRLPRDPKLVRVVLETLSSAEPELRDIALSTGVLLELPQAWACARELVLSRDPTAGHALLLLALRGDLVDQPALIAAVEADALRGAALWALGFLGTAAAADAALPWLEDEIHARVAGETLSAVTGLDLEDANLTRDAAETEAVEHRPEDDLPVPDPMGLLLWWRDKGGRFADGQRHIAGAQRTSGTLWRAVKDGPMRRRAAHLLSLQLQSPPRQRPQVELWAPSRRQRSDLAVSQSRLGLVD
jgi:uncharacterized protein (TIGR02270 family)